FKKHPIGAGPYKFVSHQPGLELILEAFEGYWRKTPHIKRLIKKVVPEESTRLAMLKKGEADIAYLMPGPTGEEVKRTPHLRLVPSGGQGTSFICMYDLWDPKSPWHDVRVRRAASYAIDRKTIVDVETFGASPIMASIVPRPFEFALHIEPDPYDPAKAKQLLKEAGYPNGFDAGEMAGTVQYASPAEAVLNYFAAVGIRARFRTMERAAWLAAWTGKKLKNIGWCGAGGFGNAATRIENYLVSTGTYSYGGYPDIDELFEKQARELNRDNREALLHKIQQLAYERMMYIPIYSLVWNTGVGPRVEDPSLDKIALYYYTAPVEDMRLKGN
ncbi:MAG: ABC transporter substrate-binding protein, partial [Nitrospinae bacterium]|nr:ABC transporter substrate-binding protein [Nitrospinota bacterium]